jgi:hypothetical protein
MFGGKKSLSLPVREVNPLLPFPSPGPSVPSRVTVELRGAFDETVTVSVSDTISSLSSTAGMRYVHKGRILCPALSFAFFNIEDGDEIFVVAPMPRIEAAPIRETQSFNTEAVERLRRRFDARYAQRFRDPEAVFEQLRDASSPVTARESARLADVFRTRVEENPAAYRRVYERLQRLEGGRFPKPRQTKTVVPEKALSPSTDLLPEVWVRSDTSQDSK